MKILTCLFIGLLIFCADSKAQHIPEGADRLELTTSLADSALFESALSFLEDEGFDVEMADEDQGTIVTNYTLIKGDIQLRILATVDNSVAVFKAQRPSQASAAKTENDPVVNRLIANEGFQAFDDIVTRYAKTLDQVTVEYHVPE